MSAASRVLRGGARALALAGVVVAVLAVRVVLSSREELAAGDRLRAQGDLSAAVVHYRRAGRWYAPGSPYPVEALDRLRQVAATAEGSGDADLALAAWRAVRSAITSTRSFYVPHADRLQEADEHIAELMSALPPPPIDAAKSRDEVRREHLELLSDLGGPSPGWTLVLLLGFAAWVAGAVAFAMRAVDAEDRIVRREAVRWGAVVVLGLALFVLGMSLA